MSILQNYQEVFGNSESEGQCSDEYEEDSSCEEASEDDSSTAPRTFGFDDLEDGAY